MQKFHSHKCQVFVFQNTYFIENFPPNNNFFTNDISWVKVMSSNLFKLLLYYHKNSAIFAHVDLAYIELINIITLMSQWSLMQFFKQS